MGDVVYVEKSHVLHLGKNNKNFSYTMNGNMLESTDKEKDIGVIISNNLKPAAHCDKVARTASGALHQILRSFSYRDRVHFATYRYLSIICEAPPRICGTSVVPLAKGRHRPAGKCPEKKW